MTYDEFERRLLKIVFEEKKASFTPSFLAYKLQVPHTTIKAHLDQALADGIVELNVEEDGKLTYLVPGFDPNASIVRHRSLPENSITPAPYIASQHGVSANDPPSETVYHEDFDESARREVDQIAPYAPISGNNAKPTTANLPAIVDDSTDVDKIHPRYTIYIRKIRIYGDFTKAELSARIASFVSELGYSAVSDSSKRIQADNDLYKRGSFLFILSLIPLFIMILPLIAYAILYSTGHSTLRSEPIYLEVGTAKLESSTPVWEITLTYRGLHGIVFGKPDRDLIDNEVEMLSSELQRH